MARRYRGNVITPLNTLGHTIELSKINPKAHTTIFGNDDAEPSVMLKAMIEHDAREGRKVIAVVFNDSYGALPQGTVVVDLTRANAQFVLDPSKADLLAALIVASPDSFMIDVGGLEPGPAARVIERLAAELSTRRTLIAPTTFAIDLIDVATPRRRMGLDADAVQQLNSLLGRGYDIGVRVLMNGNAPTEYPLEFERGTVQSIVTRVTRSAVRSVGRHVEQEQRIVDCAMIAETGVASIPQYDFWFFPMTDDPFGPYLIELPEDALARGDDDGERTMSTKTKDFTTKYIETAKKYDEERENAEIQIAAAAKLQKLRRDRAVADLVAVSLDHPARGRQRQGAIAASGAKPVKGATTRPTTAEVARMLEISDVVRPTCRARAVVTAAQLADASLALAEAVVAGKSERALKAVWFGEKLYLAGIVSKTIGGGIGYDLLGRNENEVEAFCKRLVSADADDVVGAVGRRLANAKVSRMPMDGDTRIKAIARAWSSHLASPTVRTPHADNDDAVQGVAKAA